VVDFEPEHAGKSQDEQMISIDEFKHAAQQIKGKVFKTPLVHSPTLTRMFGSHIYLKLENLQKTGSFKIRGATYKMLTHLKTLGSGGVVAASAGNHAQEGVALAARQAGIPATIVMPEWVSITKQEATRSYGGKVIIAGQTLGESLKKALALSKEGKTFIHPFDDSDIIIGQGTLALEIFEDMPDTDVIICPIGGGGLISGVAGVAKAINPKVKIIGVQAAACPSALESLRKGQIIKVKSNPSIADGISVRQLGVLPFKMIQTCVDDVVLVKEEDIAGAILMLLERKKTLAEGAGAVALAALVNKSVKISRKSKVVLLISGGNVDSPLLDRIIKHGLSRNGRITRIQVQLNDTPGHLARLLEHIARLKANILHIHHVRNVNDKPIFSSQVKLEIETRSIDHIKEIIRELKTARYHIIKKCPHWTS